MLMLFKATSSCRVTVSLKCFYFAVYLHLKGMFEEMKCVPQWIRFPYGLQALASRTLSEPVEC